MELPQPDPDTTSSSTLSLSGQNSGLSSWQEGKNRALMDRRDPSIHLGGGNGGTMNEEGCENVRGKFLTGRAIYNLGGGTPRGFKLAGFRGSRGVVLYANSD